MRDIILLHGAIGAADQLEPLATALQQKQLTTYSFSFSGHGKMPFRSEFGVEQFALELEEFIASNGLNKPIVFGYSMGGYIALYLAKMKPELFGNIITLGTKFAWSPEIAAKEVKMLNAKTITEKVPKFAEALKARHGEDWEALLQKTAEMMIGLGAEAALKDADFATINNKVVIGLADHDAMVTPDETLHVFKQLKQADMYMLPASKHPIESIDATFLAKVIEHTFQ